MIGMVGERRESSDGGFDPHTRVMLVSLNPHVRGASIGGMDIGVASIDAIGVVGGVS
jgi:hypothetical protein